MSLKVFCLLQRVCIMMIHFLVDYINYCDTDPKCCIGKSNCVKTYIYTKYKLYHFWICIVIWHYAMLNLQKVHNILSFKFCPKIRSIWIIRYNFGKKRIQNFYLGRNQPPPQDSIKHTLPSFHSVPGMCWIIAGDPGILLRWSISVKLKVSSS